MTKNERLFLFACVSLLVISVAAKYGGVLMTQAARAAVPTPQLHSPTLADIGIQLVDISTLPASQSNQLTKSAIAKSIALEVAAPYSRVSPDQLESVDAKLYLFSNTHQGTVDQTGQLQPLNRDRLVWLVTYKGIVNLPSGGPPDASHDPTNTEVNVVIDALSGNFIQAFSYR